MIFLTSGVAYLLLGSAFYAIRQSLGKTHPFMALPVILGWPWFLLALLGGRRGR